VEGKFYVWSLDEIREALKDDSDFFEAAYGITAGGNWEGKTVLQRALDDSSLAARFKLNLEAVPAKLAESHTRLYTVRALRIRPATDDKILTAWNGLMLAAFAGRRGFWMRMSHLHLRAVQVLRGGRSSRRSNPQLMYRLLRAKRKSALAMTCITKRLPATRASCCLR
jgi:uncharacterized protein YyaL (SSP411 family)